MGAAAASAAVRVVEGDSTTRYENPSFERASWTFWALGLSSVDTPRTLPRGETAAW
jgi:hypothetical protein